MEYRNIKRWFVYKKALAKLNKGPQVKLDNSHFIVISATQFAFEKKGMPVNVKEVLNLIQFMDFKISLSSLYRLLNDLSTKDLLLKEKIKGKAYYWLNTNGRYILSSLERTMRAQRIV